MAADHTWTFTKAGPPDTTPPTVFITSLADGPVLTAGSTTVTGTANVDTGLSQVEVRVGTGAWQQATGTSSWSVLVTLPSGVNTVTAAGHGLSQALEDWHKKAEGQELSSDLWMNVNGSRHTEET